MLTARRSSEQQSGQSLGQGLGPGESLSLYSLEASHLHASERWGLPQDNMGGEPDRILSLAHRSSLRGPSRGLLGAELAFTNLTNFPAVKRP